MKKIILLLLLICLGLNLDIDGQVGVNTGNPLTDLHVNGIPTPILNGNADARIFFGPPQFPGCLGRMGRFCRLTNGVPDGRYDLIRYLNAEYNPNLGVFNQLNPAFDVWMDGPCIAPNPALTGFDISYCPAGQTGPIEPLTRLRINGIGNVGLGTANPLGDLHLNGIPNPQLNDNANATMLFGPPQFPGCLGRFGRFCRLDPLTLLPDGRYDLIRYMNAEFNAALGGFQQIDPNFDVWMDGPCIAHEDSATVAGFDIAYCPPGQIGPITPLTRLRINELGNVGLGTPNPRGNLHLNGIPQLNLGNNANATMLFGPPQFPGCMGRFGRFCRLDPQTLLPDGRYDLVRYMNARYNPGLGQFEQVDADFDVWIDGPCIADNPELTGFDIAYCPAGQTGPINALTRLRINNLGNVGLGTANPTGNLHINGIPQTLLNNNANATLLFGPPQFPGCLGRFGRFCRLTNGVPDGRYDLIRYMNARFDGVQFQQVDANYDVWIDGPCIANDPALTGFDISYCPAGQAGPITPLSRLRINDLGNMGLGTTNPLGNLHLNGIPQAVLNNNANATLLFGPPQFPGCVGRFGRFCRLTNGVPDGRYDLIRYLNATFDGATFKKIDPAFDVWVEGPCIANDPTLSGYDIGYAPAGGLPGQTINPDTYLRILATGNVGLGQPDPQFRLEVNGEVGALGFVPISDASLKTDVEDLTGSLDLVKELRGVKYRFDPESDPEINFPEETQIGFLAQEVQEIIPEVVRDKGDSYLRINYDCLIPVLTEAISEQQTIIEDQTAEIDELRAEVTALKNMLKTHAELEDKVVRMTETNDAMARDIAMLKKAIYSSSKTQ